MRRRDFITVLGGAVACWPLAARAQLFARPVIGYLGSESPGLWESRLRAFHQGLAEAGYVEDRNVTIDYRWAEGRNDRLPALAAELVRRPVAVLAAPGSAPAAVAAKAATTTIPIVFYVGVDPIELGLVPSLARPGGNLTGVTSLNAEVGPKRLELVRELIPTATVVGLLLNPTNPSLESQARDHQIAADKLGLGLRVVQASTEGDFESAFATLRQARAGALIIGTDVFFSGRSRQLADLAIRHALPAIYNDRAFAAAGGLLSYGSSPIDGHRLAGVYTGRMLKGEKPADLPVMQPTRFEFVINLQTARLLGIEIPPVLLAIADEVIE